MVTLDKHTICLRSVCSRSLGVIMKLVSFIFVLLLATSALADVAILDSASTSVADVRAWSAGYSPSAGSDRLLIVTLNSEGPGAGGDKTPDSMYLISGGGGTDTLRMTLVVANGQASWNNSSIWQLKDADIVSNTYTFMWYVPTGNSNTDHGISYVLFSGVDQTTPLTDVDSNKTSSGTQLSQTVSTSAGGYVIACFSHGTAGTSATWANSYVEYHFGTLGSMSHGSAVVVPGSGTADITLNGGSNSRMTLAVYSIAPSGAPAPTSTRRRKVLLGGK